jgi:hypothetical protein
LIHYCLTASEKYFRNIQDENKLKNMLKPCRNEIKNSKQIKRLLTVTELMYEESNRDDELIILLLLQMMSLACWERATLNTQPTTVRIVT